MKDLTENDLITLIRLVQNLINAGDNSWENKDLLAKLQREYNDRTLYKVFLEDKQQLQNYTDNMLKLIKSNAEKQFKRFNLVCNNCVACEIKEEFVESE